jgi:hypothetical protein
MITHLMNIFEFKFIFILCLELLRFSFHLECKFSFQCVKLINRKKCTKVCLNTQVFLYKRLYVYFDANEKISTFWSVRHFFFINLRPFICSLFLSSLFLNSLFLNSLFLSLFYDLIHSLLNKLGRKNIYIASS